MSQAIQVFGRVRPCADHTNDYPGIAIDEIDSLKLRIDLPSPTFPVRHQFAFDHIFWKDSRQEDIFSIVASPLLRHSLEGYNATLFAYGQTGSGKTYTITGPGTRASMGVVPRAIEEVYATMRSEPIEVSISYLEIYNNNAFDLLSQIGVGQVQRLEDLRKVTIVDTGKTTIFKDLTVERAPTFEDAHRMFWSGEALRQKAETVNNKYSSRSHTVFTFYFTRRTETTIISSRINFVDLAGSEKYESLSNEVDRRKLEARHINKSLHTLQSVIIGLNQRHSHIPFRDSTLTRFLKDSLVGNVRTAMIATLSTHKAQVGETISTCRFAESVASVTTTSRLRQQELPPQEMIGKLREEVTRLREELSRCQAPTSSPITSDEMRDLQHQVVEFIDDDHPGASLDVTDPERVQLCFRFMKELIKKNDGSSVAVSKLRRELEERDRRLENFIRIHTAQPAGLSKEAAYLKFCNEYKHRAAMQRMKDTIRDRCATTKKLNDTATQLRRRCTELSDELDTIGPTIEDLQARAKTAKGEQREALARELEELTEKQAQIEEELARGRAEFDRKSDELRLCKDEIIRLQSDYHEQRAVLQQEFEEYWLGNSQAAPRPGKRPAGKGSATFYSHS
jgi:kinesin family protein 6/9